MLKYFLFLFNFTIISIFSFAQSYEAKNQKEFKANAEKYFLEENYQEAYKAYSQLVANFPKDPIFNYRLGVSMLFADPDKSKAKKYLDVANQYRNEIPKAYFFYLGKYYHYNYEFDQAIKSYDNFKLLVKKSEADKLKVDNEIKACESGKALLNQLSDLTVLDKKELPASSFFLSYDFNQLGGRLIAKPQEFKTESDLKKKDNSVAFISTNTDQLFISNYGSDKTKGKDIYVVNKKGDGWGTPKAISSINTDLDEDFPFLHPNGKILYFASKGHNTMGGYDVFKSAYDPSTDTWGKPINLDFPINTPLDDILFATDSSEQYAFFASNRASEGNNFTIYKINTQRKAPELVAIQGLSVSTKEGESKKSVITVVNKNTGEVFGPISATDDGKYLLQIANGGKFDFTVETPGFRSQSQEVQLKQYMDLRPVLQFITYNEGLLSIKSYLDTSSANNYAQMIELIKQRANLKVDTNASAAPTLADIKPDKVDATTVVNKPVEAIQTTALTEQQIIQTAQQDADAAKAEVRALKNAFNYTQLAVAEKAKAKSEAESEVLQIQEALKTSSSADSAGLKSALVLKQNEINLTKDQNQILENLASELNVNADKKNKEADLLQKYANDIALVSKAKDKKTALNNLDQLQKDMVSAGTNIRSSKDILEEYKDKANAKANAADVVKQQVSTLKSDLIDFKNERDKVKEDLETTKDKDLKKTYQEQIEELEKDIAEKEVKLIATQQQADVSGEQTKQAEELMTIVNGAEEAAKVAASKPAEVTPNTILSDATKTNRPQLSESYVLAQQSLSITSTDSINMMDANALKATNDRILSFNKAIDKEMLVKKTESAKTVSVEDKNRIQGIIDELLVQKQSNNTVQAAIKAKQKELIVANQPVVVVKPIVYSAAYEKIRTESFPSSQLMLDSLNPEDLKQQSKQVLSWNKAIDVESQLQKNALLKYKAIDEKNQAQALINELKSQKQSNTNLLAANARRQKDLNPSAPTIVANTTVVSNTTAPKVFEYSPSFQTAKRRYDSTLVGDLNLLDANKIDAQKSILTDYNKVIDKEIANKTIALNKTANVNDKAKLNALVSDLRLQKKENSQAIGSMNAKQKADALAANSNATNTSANPSTNVSANPSANNVASTVDSRTLGPLPAMAANEVVSDSSKAGDYVAEQLKTKSVWNNAIPELVKDYYGEVSDEKIYFSIFTEDIKRLDNLNKEIKTLEQQKRKSPLAKQPALQTQIESKLATKQILNQDITKNIKSLNRLAFSRNKSKVKIQLDSFAGSSETRDLAYQLVGYADKRFEAANQLRDSSSKVAELNQKSQLLKLAEQKEKQALEGLVSAITMTKPLVTKAIDTVAVPAVVKIETPLPINEIPNKGYNSISSIGEAPVIKTTNLDTMNPQRVVEIKKTIEFKSFANLKSDAKKLETSIKTLESKVNALQSLTARNETIIKTLATKPNSEKSIKDYEKTNQLFLKQIDSINEINYNTRAAAEAKHLEADLMLYNLNEVQASEIVAVSGFKPITQNSEVPSLTKTDLPQNNTSDPLAKERSDKLMLELDSIRATTNNKITTTKKPKVEAVVVLPFGNEEAAYVANQVDFNGAGYSEANPIPIDPPLPDGLIFKVQIGSFKTRPNAAAFGKITPITGESTPSGYTRYTAGSFDQFASANGAKRDLSSRGFRDAYVVAYYNGKRISLDSARKIKGTEPVAVPIAENTKTITPKKADYIVPVQKGIETKAIEVQEGLTYTVQIGAYSRLVTKKDLYNLDPIYTEKRSNTLYSYTTGLYKTLGAAIERKNFAVSVGVRDAFVRAFQDGKRISLEQARQIELGGNQPTNSVLLEQIKKDSTTDPIEAPSANPSEPVPNEPSSIVKPPKANIVLYDDSTFTIINFENGIQSYPIPDQDNGVKLDDNGICFRVQIGVFQGEIPIENKAAFMAIKNWPIRGFKFANGLTKYNVGNFTNPVSANILKQEVSAAGVQDAFVIAYYDNKRISVADAMKILENGGKR